jgi:hypothetical protein
LNKVHIYRDAHAKQTLGELMAKHDGKDFTCKTIELPWLDNKHMISCIPDGTYKLVKHTSPRWGRCLKVMDVPDRTDILIHPGNYAGSINPKTGKSDLLGCIAPGEKFTDIDGDGLVDITNSTATMQKLMNFLPDETMLTIETLKFHAEVDPQNHVS